MKANWFEVACVDDYPYTLDKIEAAYHKQAAEIFVDKFDEEEEGRELATKERSKDVMVRLLNTEEEWMKLRVRGSVSYDYHAEKIEDNNE